MTALRYPRLSDETRQHISGLIESRAITDRARVFLRLALSAVESQPPAGVRAQWYGNAILLSGDQQRIGQLLDCSSRTFQRAIDRANGGEFSAFCWPEMVTIQQDAGRASQRLVYVIAIDRLEAIPATDPTDEFEAVILKYGPGLLDLREQWANGAESIGSVQFAGDVASDVARDVVPVSPDCRSDVVPLMNHDHVHEHENKTHEHDHESWKESRGESQNAGRGPIATTEVRFSQITADHVERVVRQNDYELFGAFFADLKAAGWSSGVETEWLLLAALFHQVHRIGKAKSPGGVIAKLWKSRNDVDPKKRPRLADADDEFSRQLLRVQRSKTQPKTQPATIALTMKTPADEFAADEIRRQEESRAKQRDQLLRLIPN